ncbi:hypothetical protein BJ875DRAFT_481052 [Amylocarpus encephaloides]|uniref:Uncharacterized protein n=1 Tax=Amylocarpus encephaloides TaxID=45428 RepID=A0A9P8CA39_9HELO|nr:hypothetical protein BJ875DRAFT_481052 [Amylocarpus encephaloides]
MAKGPRLHGRSRKKGSSLDIPDGNNLQIVIEQEGTPPPAAGRIARQQKRKQKKLQNTTKVIDLTYVEGGGQVEVPVPNHRAPAAEQNWRRECMEIFTNVGIASDACVTSMEAAERVGKWLQFCGVQEGDERIDKIEELCGTISKFLRSRRAPPEPSSPNKSQTSPESSGQSMDQFFVYRDVRQVISLGAPMETAKAFKSIKNKTFGFVRIKGKYWPMICAISGIDNVIHTNPKFLDSYVWTAEVYHLMSFRDAEIRCARWEKHRKLPKGFQFCSHVEPKLMLWFACWWLTKVTGEIPSIRKQVANIFKINGRNMPEPPEAEIFLDRAPCRTCLKYQKEITEMSGIEFTFQYMPKAGRIQQQKDKHGNVIFPICADEDDLASTDSETADDHEDDNAKDEIQGQLVIRRSPKHHHSNSRHIRRHTKEVVVNTESGISRIQSYEFNAGNKITTKKNDDHRRSSLQARAEDKDSEDDDATYTPPTPSPKKRPHGATASDRRVKTRRSEPGIPRELIWEDILGGTRTIKPSNRSLGSMFGYQ